MRKLILLYTITLMAIACNRTLENRFEITGTIHGAEEGEMICLYYPVKHDNIWYKQCDTTYIESGQFRFNGTTDSTIPATLSFRNMDAVEIYVEPTQIKFEAERNTLYDYTIQGLSIDAELSDYLTSFGELDSEIFTTAHAVTQKNEEWTKAYNEDREDIDSLWNEFYTIATKYRQLTDEWNNVAIKFIEEYPDYTITLNLKNILINSGYNIDVDNQPGGAMNELLMIRNEIAQTCGGEIGSKAHDFEMADLEGNNIHLSNYYSKGYILLDFWASWCHPCINEIPKLRNVHKEFSDKLQIISLSVDSDRDKWQKAVEQYELNSWSQLITSHPEDAADYYFQEQGDISLAYGVEYIPCFMLINTEGYIIGRWSHLTDEIIGEIRTMIEE